MAGDAPATAEAAHPRHILSGFLSPDLCKELEFIHKSCSTVGYRTGVLSTTLGHLAATGCCQLAVPIVQIRERLKEKVEEIFDCRFELFVEFTGLISWCKGASIGWHSDDNKPYLKQRDFSAVCYLNNYGTDFKGGILRFQNGEPSSVLPVAGDVAIYTADSRNVHCVDEVAEGERLTLTLWFTRDNQSDEDPKLINLLSLGLERERANPNFFIPFPASDNMYWVCHNGSGFDLRSVRIRQLGLKYYYLNNSNNNSNCDDDISGDVSGTELLGKSLFVGTKNEVFEKEFINSLHALQAVEFYYWKSSEVTTIQHTINIQNSTEIISNSTKSNYIELVLPCDYEFAESIFMRKNHEKMENLFNFDKFLIAVENWEKYNSELKRQLLNYLPKWRIYGSIYYIDPSNN
ncbi:hypothetical protein LUZ60_006106 [Juncus effusus]|nr:hypothetical protein LUZ60_006106 [Juncus effusus]